MSAAIVIMQLYDLSGSYRAVRRTGKPSPSRSLTLATRYEIAAWWVGAVAGTSAGAVACCVGVDGGRNRVVAGGGAADATWLGGALWATLGGGLKRGGGGAGGTVSPCGTLRTVGDCSDDSGGGASLPRAGVGARRCAVLAGCRG